MKEKYYIAGKVSGKDFKTTRKQFAKAQLALAQQGKDAVNPVEQIEALNRALQEFGLPVLTDAKDRKKILGYCMNALSGCDAIYLLPGYEQSQGALLELAFAKATGMKIVYPL